MTVSLLWRRLALARLSVCLEVRHYIWKLRAIDCRRSQSHTIPETKIITDQNRAQTRFPGKPRIYPQTPAAQPFQGAQIAAQKRFTRRTSCFRTEFSDLSQKIRKDHATNGWRSQSGSNSSKRPFTCAEARVKSAQNLCVEPILHYYYQFN